MDHSQHSISNHGDHSQHHHEMMAPMPPATMDESHSADHAHMMHDHGSMEHMMSMAFHFGYNETILFSFWKISTAAGLVGSMAIIFTMALLYEGLKYYREHLFWKTYNLLEYRPVSMPDKPPEERRPAPPAVHLVGEVIHKQPPTIFSINHLYQTFLHIIQVTLSFLLMLIFMTYNIWLCIAVVLGAGLGYFLFCWKKSVIVDVTEHCH